MTRQLVYSLLAREGLSEIASYIVDRSGSEKAGIKFATEIDQRCRKLARLPGLLGRARPNLGTDLRSVSHGNYLIFFRYSDKVLTIVTILHAARDLDYIFEDDQGDP